LYLGEGPVIRFDLSPVAEKDIVYNAGDGNNSVFGDHSGDAWCFVEDGWTNGAMTADGLPANRRVESVDTNLGTYVLLPYDGSNVIELATLGPAESHTVTAPATSKLARIGVLAASCWGQASFACEIRYDDYSVTTNWWGADDWSIWERTDQLVVSVCSNMDRAVASTGEIDDADLYNLYEFIIDAGRGLDTNKAITSITFKNAESWPSGEERYTAIFAVNGYCWDDPQADSHGWQDVSFYTGLVVSLRMEDDGFGRITLPPMPSDPGYTNPGIWGNVFSPKISCDVGQSRILEVGISGIAASNVGYNIGLQQYGPPYAYKQLFADSRPGTIVCNIPELTGWSGPFEFFISIGFSSVDTNNSHELVVDYVKLRGDHNVAWSDDFDPMRPSWIDESVDPTFNAWLDQWSDGLARLRQTGETNWGRVDSEMVALDLWEYPIARVAVENVDVDAGFLSGVQYQTYPWAFAQMPSGSQPPCENSLSLKKGWEEILDLIRMTMIIEGSNKTALIDWVDLCKRAPGHTTLHWDAKDFMFSIGEGQVLRVPLTATDFGTNGVVYDSHQMPGGAAYDGFFTWTTAVGQAGTYHPVVFGHNDTGWITNRLTITITNATIQRVAPEWDQPVVVTPTNTVTLTGRYWPSTTNDKVQVSVNGGGYSTAGVTQTNRVFEWTGEIAGPAEVSARLYDTTKSVQSSAVTCEVFPGGLGAPRFLDGPFLEMESLTSAWVLVRATTQVTARVLYGRVMIDECLAAGTVTSLTHALPAAPLTPGCGYWCQVLIGAANGKYALSDPLYYPPEGLIWREEFDSEEDVNSRWRDHDDGIGSIAVLTVTNGQGYISLPGAPPEGWVGDKVLSEVITADLDQYPILEMHVSGIAPSNVGYSISVLEQKLTYTNEFMLEESRVGTLLLNIPHLTGWTGTMTFALQFYVSSVDPNPQSVALDYVRLRTDRNLA
ncbi:MAG: hypothetical protein JXQ75_05615, partial [Phycisphaerae bacterium]|nr:hypothetical protein [Phycisphaerae bacterium]